MALDCEHYDNDEVMAQLGRKVVDQYIGMMRNNSGVFADLRGAASYIVNSIGEYVKEVEERKDCADCRYHKHFTTAHSDACFCLQEMGEHKTCCEQLMGGEYLEDAALTCPNFSQEE